MSVKIAPSILAADFANLEKEVKKVEAGGADFIHIDVMDGNFVPNITIGPCVIKAIRKITRLPLEAHLMIRRPEYFIDDFVKAGADMVTVHIETMSPSMIKKQAKKLKPKGIKLGVSLNPRTPLSRIKGVLDWVDFVLVMSVNPGFSGQKFMPSAIGKIKSLRKIFDGDIAVDGGITDVVAADLINAGADILTAASFIFAADDYKKAIERLRNASQ